MVEPVVQCRWRENCLASLPAASGRDLLTIRWPVRKRALKKPHLWSLDSGGWGGLSGRQPPSTEVDPRKCQW